MISPVSTSFAPPALRPGKPAGSAGFSLPEAPDAPEAPRTASLAGPAAASLLSLQEFTPEPEPDRRKRTLRHGQNLLARLGQLQSALLGGALDPALLDELAALAATPTDAADPRLAALISAVVTRARVELAKRAR